LVGAIFIFCLAPFLWLVLSSLKYPRELYKLPLTYIPSQFSLDAYKELTSNPLFLRYSLNSIMVSLLTTFVCLVLAALAGYSLSRLKIKFKITLQFLLLLACLFPQIIFLIPLYELMAKFNLYQ
jgi:ABC-type glycerol-3-phosphate transport system permease component